MASFSVKNIKSGVRCSIGKVAKKLRQLFSNPRNDYTRLNESNGSIHSERSITDEDVHRMLFMVLDKTMKELNDLELRIRQNCPYHLIICETCDLGNNCENSDQWTTEQLTRMLGDVHLKAHELMSVSGKK